MQTNWQTKKFEDCLDKVVYTKKIQRKDFLKSGLFSIVSQESENINGYWNEEKDLFKCKKPVIIFGDHTQVLKYVDFDFVLGADGVKILQPKEILDSKFFYFFLQSVNLKNLGYARHYRLLKEIEILFPPLPEQHRIVKILDETFEKIKKAKENAGKNLQNSKELFESYLQNVFAPPSLKLRTGKESLGKDWEEKKLGEVCEELFAGGDVPKNNSSKTKSDKFSIPIFSNGEKNKGLYGYTNVARVKKPSITVSARGTIGYSEIREEPFYPAIRLIVATPNIQIIDLYFLQYIIQNMDFVHSGTSIPQLTVPMIKEYLALIPPFSEQKSIVSKLDALSAETKKLETIYKQKLADLEELKKSVLKRAFNREL